MLQPRYAGALEFDRRKALSLSLRVGAALNHLDAHSGIRLIRWRNGPVKDAARIEAAIDVTEKVGDRRRRVRAIERDVDVAALRLDHQANDDRLGGLRL